MTSTALITVEEYLRLSVKPNCEYRDGFLYSKALANTSHGRLQFTVALMLSRLGLQAAPEVTVRLSPTKYLVPDVIAAPVLQNPYPTEPVLLCCEILSPEDRLGTMLTKCEEYHDWGAPYCWVIDPIKRTAWEYHSGDDPVRVSEALHAGQHEISLDELFSRITP